MSSQASSKPQADSVIWIASYPKSGNTWVQSVARAAGRSFGFPTEDLDVYKMKASGKQPMPVRGVQPGICGTGVTVLKTHAAFSQWRQPHRELKLKTVGFAYVMRNPLDMLLSYINFTRLAYATNQDNPAYQKNLFLDLLGFRNPIPFDQWQATTLEDIPRQNLDHALLRFAGLGTAIPGVKMAGGTWLNHCMSWHKAGEKLPSITLRYEDLLDGPANFYPLQKLFQFSEDQITDAVKRVNESQRALQYKKVFYNKMSAYYYPEFFSPEVIQKVLLQFEMELKKLGYGNLYAGGMSAP